MNHIFWISLGAVFGANARYWLGTWVTKITDPNFPYGTLLINVSGSLLIGFVMTLLTDKMLVDVRWKLVFVVGFLGAFTTFSTFSYDNFLLLTKGAWIAGLSNLLGSAVLGVLAVAVGVLTAKLF